MKNNETYRYESALLKTLQEKYDEYLDYADKYGIDDDFTEGRLDAFLYIKDYVEEMLNKAYDREKGISIIIDKEGSIVIGDAYSKDGSYKSIDEYLTILENECRWGEIAQRCILESEDSKTGLSFKNETLADFIDTDEIDAFMGTNGNYCLKAINEALAECGIKPVELISGELYTVSENKMPEFDKTDVKKSKGVER